jgi:hypothetical protein
MRLLALTLDLDAPADYAALHGLPAVPRDQGLMYDAPLARFAEMCASIGAPATLFAIGRDLTPVAAARLRELRASGHEIASHSFAHDYHLTRAPDAAVREDVARAHEALVQAVGEPPVGFRAPGHHLSGVLLDALELAGYRYDSSVLPSPPYYLAKAGVMAAYRALGRHTAALLGSPRLPLAPRRPYRPGLEPYTPGPRGLWELPIAVAGLAGLPVTGATLALAPARLRALLARGLEDLEVVVLDLHAMDFVDLDHDDLAPEVSSRQPELAIAWPERERRLREALGAIAQGRAAVTCAAVAARLSAPR